MPEQYINGNVGESNGPTIAGTRELCADERFDECWLVMQLSVKPISKPQRRLLITYEANELSGWLRSSSLKRETVREVCRQQYMRL